MEKKLYLEPLKRIKINRLLNCESQKTDYNFILELKKIMSNSSENLSDNCFYNLTKISEDNLAMIHAKYGQEGLFDVSFLVLHTGKQFEWYLKLLMDTIKFMNTFKDFEVLGTDNNSLPYNKVNEYFNTKLFIPSLSRKIYRMGTPLGAGVVFGFGRPRILVSLPFIGANAKTETYDVYINSLDVMTSLSIRGYFGSFMFMDYLPGLSSKINDIPLWLIWFSFVANNSDSHICMQLRKRVNSITKIRDELYFN